MCMRLQQLLCTPRLACKAPHLIICPPEEQGVEAQLGTQQARLQQRPSPARHGQSSVLQHHRAGTAGGSWHAQHLGGGVAKGVDLPPHARHRSKRALQEAAERASGQRTGLSVGPASCHALAASCLLPAAPSPPVPSRGLLNHAHIVRRRLVVLDVPAVDKLQLCRGQDGGSRKGQRVRQAQSGAVAPACILSQLLLAPAPPARPPPAA